MNIKLINTFNACGFFKDLECYSDSNGNKNHVTRREDRNERSIVIINL